MELLSRLLDVMASIPCLRRGVSGAFQPGKIGHGLKSCFIILQKIPSGGDTVCGVHHRMLIDVALDGIYELACGRAGSSTIERDSFKVPDDITRVGVRAGVKKCCSPAYALLVCKIDFPWLRLTAKVFSEGGIVLLCEGHSELDLTFGVKAIPVRSAHIRPCPGHELKYSGCRRSRVLCLRVRNPALCAPDR